MVDDRGLRHGFCHPAFLRRGVEGVDSAVAGDRGAESQGRIVPERGRLVNTDIANGSARWRLRALRMQEAKFSRGGEAAIRAEPRLGIRDMVECRVVLIGSRRVDLDELIERAAARGPPARFAHEAEELGGGEGAAK